jgi:ATP-binding cassette subfamily B protein
MDRHKYTETAIIRRLIAEARPYWRVLLLILFLDLAATPLALLTPVPLKIAVDNVIQSHPLPALLDQLIPPFARSTPMRLLILAAVLQVVIGLTAQLLTMSVNVLRTRTGENLTLLFRAKTFRRAQLLSLLFHDMKGTSDSIHRIQYDSPAIQFITAHAIPLFITSIVSLFVTLYVIFRIDWQLALVGMTIAPVLFLLSRSHSRHIRPKWKNLKRIQSSSLGVVQEVMTSLRVVKAFGREDDEQERFVDTSRKGVREYTRLALYEGGYGLLITLTTALGSALVLYIGVRNVLASTLTVGELLMVIAYLAQLYAPMRTMVTTIGTLQSHIASAERTFELLDHAPDVQEHPHPKSVTRAKGAVDFQKVTFSYDGHHPVLRDISFAVPTGAKVGIAGKTGAGKTTLTNLLMRFYDPNEGQILLDGTDLRNYRLSDLRNQFALVLQEPVLFSTSIFDNIRYAFPEATEREVEEAARAANAHEFIVDLPDGYNTLVGERGMRLSGGERQRISLARAFLKAAPVLILDEPTSSVDVRTEALIMEAMERLMSGRTAFMIAHRLSTLENCQIRIELDHGRVLNYSHAAPAPSV